MQSLRITSKVPRSLQHVKAPASIITTRKMSFFPRFMPHELPRFVANDFAPVWRLLDDYANQVASTRAGDVPGGAPVRGFNPRFDVKEINDTYELHGELPGVEQKDVEIEFPDHQTLVIKGNTQYSREERPQSEAEQVERQQPDRQPTVEDEPSTSDANPDAEPNETSVVTQEVQKTDTAGEVGPSARYWLTERFTGQFQRTSNFPVPVDTDSVKAKLKNGVLEVVIPKAVRQGTKRVAIQ